MKFHISVLTLLMLLALLASACSGGAPAALQPTEVQSIPTATPAPTNTPVPPTDTPVPPTQTPAAVATTALSGNASGLSGIFGSALDKAKAATVYRVDMQMSARGAFGALSQEGTPAPAVNQDVPLFSINGEVKDQDSHFKMQGFIAAFLGADPTKGLEVTTVGSKAYIHGPVPMLGATEDKWYEMPASQASAVKPPLTSQSFLDSLTQSGMNPNDFKKTGTETLDNQSCDVYTGDKDAVMKAFQDVGKAAGGTGDSNQVIDTADFKFWICSDGFMHQVRLSVEGHDKTKPDQKGSFLMLLHLSDLNGSDIQIQAPANAEPLKMPSFLNLGTPTP